MKEAREWFLYKSVSEDEDTLTAVPRGNDPYDQYANMITVIEKSEYNKLRAQLDIAKAALDKACTCQRRRAGWCLQCEALKQIEENSDASKSELYDKMKWFTDIVKKS